MLKANTAEEICKLVNTRDDNGTEIHAIDRRTGRVHDVIARGETINTARFRYQNVRIQVFTDADSDGGGYIEVDDDYSITFAQVRSLLALARKATRAGRKQITYEMVDGNDTDYIVVARADGSIKVGCQDFSAEEVRFVVSQLPKERKARR